MALAFAGAGQVGVAVAFFGATAILVALTLAPWLWFLHRLPVLGAPSLELRFRGNGADEGDSRADRGEIVLCVPEDRVEFRPITVIVELEVKNPSSVDVTGALLNFGCVTGHEMALCDGWGISVDRGSRMLPTVDGFDYQAITDLRYSAGDSHLAYLRFKVRRPGVFPIYAQIGSGDLYRKREILRFVDIRIVESEEVPFRDRFAPAIARGELLRMSGSSAFNEDQLREEVGALYLEAHRVVLEAERQDLHDRLSDAEPIGYVGLRAGDEYHRAMANTYTRTLIEMRDVLGRQEARGAN